MDSITQILNQAFADTVEHLGVTVFICGVKYEAIFQDTPYEDEVGKRRILTLSINSETSKLFSRGDNVLVGGESFIIGDIPTTTDPLVEMELKSA